MIDPRLAIVLFAWAATALPSAAQESSPPRRIRPLDGPLVRLRYDVPTGSVTRAGGAGAREARSLPAGVQRAFSQCFDGSLVTGYSAAGTNGFEWVDFAAKGCHATGWIRAFAFGYASTASGPGGALRISFHAGGAPFCGSLGPEVASFLFTGLPGCAATGPCPGFLVTAVLGGSSAFQLPDGPIAWGYTPLDGPLGTPAATGPLLTELSANTGWSDVYDAYNRWPAALGTCLGGFDFGGCTTPVPPPPTGVPCAGFYLELFEQQAKNGTAVVRNAAPNVASFVFLGSDSDGDCLPDGVVTGPMVGENWLSLVGPDPGHLITIMTISRDPLPGGFPLDSFGGTRLLCLGGIANDYALAGTPHCVAVPDRLDILDLTLCTQGVTVRGPWLTFNKRFRNAIDVTFGIR